MKPAKDSPKKAARRKPKTPASASDARATFAEALATAQMDSAVIGFDRSGRTVAALVPVEAVYMLAGLGEVLDDAARDRIERAARLFVHNMPNQIGKKRAPPRAAGKARSRAKRH